jgi:hypothetical protein
MDVDCSLLLTKDHIDPARLWTYNFNIPTTCQAAGSNAESTKMSKLV